MSDSTWWDERYKSRRPIALEPDALNPGSESLSVVKLNKNRINGKIKSDYSDLSVIYGDQSIIQYSDQGPFTPDGVSFPTPTWDGPEGYTFLVYGDGFVTSSDGELLTAEV